MVFAFYNDSKAETMPEMILSLKSFKEPVILIAGGKDNEDLNFDPFAKEMIANARVISSWLENVKND